MSGLKKQLARKARQQSHPVKPHEAKPTTDQSSDVPVSLDTWPTPPAQEAFHGLAGEFVEMVDAHTESDPVALLIQFLVGFGNVIGRCAHFAAEGHQHFCNLFVALVGSTSKGRKGSSWSHVLRVLHMVDEFWAAHRVGSGLSSGEGLISQVRDPIQQQQPIKEGGRVVDYQKVTIDPGESDKRLLVIEEEFVRVLASMGRESNILSAVLRGAWDSGNLGTMTKNSPLKATGAHISIVGHVTRDELRRALNEIEQTNGFANRFLWCCVRRSKSLPEGGRVHEVDFDSFRYRLSEAIRFASDAGRLERDDQARERWHRVYDELSAGKPGLLGAVTARAEVQVMRLACLYALLDLSAVIRLEHLNAGLALWDYCERSAAYIFGTSLGNRTADTLLAALRQSSDVGLARTEILHHGFNKNKTAAEITDALRLLHDNGLARAHSEVDSESGRIVERWFATGST